MLLPPTPKKPDPLARLLTQPAFEGLPISLVQHCQAVPLGILVRGTLEWLLDETDLERLFQEQAFLLAITSRLRRLRFRHPAVLPSASTPCRALGGRAMAGAERGGAGVG
jgi:hypothetical protein